MAKRSLLFLVVGMIELSCLFGTLSAADNPPTVSITSPANGATVSGSVSVAANATDDVAVTQVGFYVDNVLKSIDTSAPYAYSLNTTAYTNGSHTIKAVAVDTSSQTATSQISITINNVVVPPIISTPTPADTTPPLVSAVTSTNITSSGALIKWTTNELANSKVEYGLTTSYGKATPLADVNGIYSHSVTLSGLTEKTLYHYRIVTVDMAGNPTMTGDYSFTTISSPVDNPPTVSITSPANGATVSGSVSVTANATDDIAVTQVGFYVDNVLKSIDTSAPYAYSLNTTAYTNGSHTIKAVAVDTSSQTATSQISVTINNVVTPPPVDNPPTVSITSPANGATISGSVNVTANATDDKAVTQVDFYVDNVLKSIDTSAPYAWSLDTTAYTNGSHTIKAVAVDTSSQTATAQISVMVNNVVTPPPVDNPPTVTITNPANGATVSGSVSVTANATDDIAVTQVGFYVDSVLKSIDTSAPYAWSLNTTAYSNGSHTIKAVAVDTSSQTATSQISVTVNNVVISTPTPNTAPVLSWTGEPNYPGARGLYPETGTSTTTFVYRVKYTDADNDAPKTGYPRVHIEKGGIQISGSPFVMTAVDTNAYSSGRVYSYAKQLTELGNDYSYKFEAQDINNAIATGVTATWQVDAPDVSNTPNNPPVAYNQSVSTPKDTAKTITLVATDTETDSLIYYAIITQPAHGTLTGNAPKLIYTPASGYTGTDSFTFKAMDGDLFSNLATVSITVVAPVVGNSPTVSITSPANGAKVSGSVNVTANATDDIAVTQVGFYVDNVLKSIDTSVPYGWSLDTKAYSNGSHTIKAVAVNTSSQTATNQISVTFDNAAVHISTSTAGRGIRAVIGPKDTVINPMTMGGQKMKVNYSIGGKTNQSGEMVHVTVTIYNARGEFVKTLIDEDMAVGEYQSMWDGRNFENDIVASGVYIVRIKAGDFTSSKKIAVVK
ncbi:MAG: Ig-like domain-containing protein [Elusimicrobia bacterium]|nr:Ig-like domain-containing protein [Elusimicrobiota bacterium]